MEVLKQLQKEYNIIKKIGSGSFGEVYKAQQKDTGEFLAIKIENNTKMPRLKSEMALYNELKDGFGIPKMKSYSTILDKNVLVMDYLGPSLEDLFEFCNHRFSLKTVSMLALQLLDRIEFLHNKNIIHRDIKPDNFLIGSGKKKNQIYIIDLGLSKKIVDRDLNHIEYSKNKSFTGSFRYSSIRNHKGIEQSRRDDLESIGYMLIFFLKGTLPWQGLKGSTKSKRSKNIFKEKRNTSLESLCTGIPRCFFDYMKYVRLLRFPQKPNYKYLKDLFIDIFSRNNYIYDDIFDWNIVAKEKKRIKNSTLTK
jgi:serine/threonine protein kinase